MTTKQDARVEAAAKRLAEWFGYAWDGLRDDGRVTDKGFKPWCFNGLGDKCFQGQKQDVRDIVLEIAALADADRVTGEQDVECPRCHGNGCELPSFSANFLIACKQCGGRKRIPSPTSPDTTAAVEAAVKAERERCAHIALAIDSKRGNEKLIAAAIRKGEKT